MQSVKYSAPQKNNTKSTYLGKGRISIYYSPIIWYGVRVRVSVSFRGGEYLNLSFFSSDPSYKREGTTMTHAMMMTHYMTDDVIVVRS
jgi:hypothetical protein